MCDCNGLAESFRSPPALRSEETSSIESLGVGVDDDRGTLPGAPESLGAQPFRCWWCLVVQPISFFPLYLPVY